MLSDTLRPKNHGARPARLSLTATSGISKRVWHTIREAIYEISMVTPQKQILVTGIFIANCSYLGTGAAGCFSHRWDDGIEPRSVSCRFARWSYARTQEGFRMKTPGGNNKPDLRCFKAACRAHPERGHL